MNPVGRFARGFELGLRGLARAARTPEVRKTYVWVVALLFVVTLTLDGLGLWATFRFLPFSSESAWARWISYGLAPVLVLVTLFAAPLVALASLTLFVPPLADLPFFGVLRVRSPTRSAILETMGQLVWTKSVLYTIRRLGTFLLSVSGLFVLGFLPVLGPALAALGQLSLLSFMATWELLDPYLARRGSSYVEQRALLFRRLPETLGFGLPVGGLLAIPFVGPLFFPLAQGAAAEFVADLFEEP